MSWFQKQAFKDGSNKRRKETRTRRIRQSRLPKPPKDYNGSKSVAGKFPVAFQKASKIRDEKS